MFNKLRNNGIETSQKGSSEIERMLTIMPKHCTCTACTSLKEEAKAKLGKDKYNTIVNAGGLAQ